MAGAPAFDLADITNTVGAPSFAHFCEGREHEQLGNRVHPAITNPVLGGLATHPCKKRKDGAPSVWMVQTEIKTKGWATRL